MVPPETLSIAPNSGSFIISPNILFGATIADTAASGTGWTTELSYDTGVTWFTLDAAAPVGSWNYALTVDLPSVTPSGTCQLRVTNNTTLATATSSGFSIVGDQVLLASLGQSDAQTIRMVFEYASDFAAATPTPSPPTDIGINADTDAGPEAPDSITAPSGNTADYHFNDPLTAAGNFNVTADGTETWDRPFAALLVPQTIVM